MTDGPDLGLGGPHRRTGWDVTKDQSMGSDAGTPFRS